jgi:hypothetical protein
MSGLDSLLDRLRETYASISEVEAVAACVPGDRYVLANLESIKKVASQLEEQWDLECLNQHTEVCRYRILSGSNYSIASFSKSLLEFQGLFTQIFDSIKNGAKRRSRVSADIVRETCFDFGYSYPGSLGVALTLKGNPDLFSGGFDRAVDAFIDAMNIDDEYQVRDTAKILGYSVIKRIHDWSSANLDANFEIDINWTTSKGIKKGGLIGVSNLSKLVEIIRRTSDIDKRNILVEGTLLGLDSKTGHFRFVPSGNGPDYKGRADETFPILKEWSLNSNYTAEICIEETTQYATQESNQVYKLKSLTNI